MASTPPARRALRGRVCYSLMLVVAVLGGCKESEPEAKAGGARDKKKERSPAAPGAGPGAPTETGGGVPEAASYLLDLGFRPNKDGFSFRNGDYDDRGQLHVYPATSKGFLDVDGVQRIFGSKNVCAAGTAAASCKLTPPAKEFMHKVNLAMNGGQCDGMAVAALALWKGLDKPGDFAPGATTVQALGREQMRAAVGYYWAYIQTMPFRRLWTTKYTQVTPNDTLDELMAHLQPGKEPVTLWFWAPPGAGGGAHAVVPYAVEDRGNQRYWVRIWDNNHPNVSRYIEFDKAANKWRYDLASPNPDTPQRPWYGDASIKGIIVVDLSHRMNDADCHICPSNTQTRQIWLTGNGRALITDSQGRKLGFDNGNYVNEIPGAQLVALPTYLPGVPPPEPVYFVPAGDDYDIAVVGQDGGGAGKADVAIFGGGHALVMDYDTKQGDRDHLHLSADGQSLRFRSEGAAKSPAVRLALDLAGDDYQIDLGGLAATGELALNLDPGKLQLVVESAGARTTNFDFTVTRHLADGSTKSFSKADQPKGLVESDHLDFGAME
jgi:hypothetical protein